MLFESSPLPMWVFDAKRCAFSRRTRRRCACTPTRGQEFLSMTVEDICRPEDCEAFRQFPAPRIRVGEPRRVPPRNEGRRANRYRRRRLSGELARAVPRALVLINDITERLRTQHALEFSQERLRALSRRLLEVQEQERRRLARDLHDDVGQALTALRSSWSRARASRNVSRPSAIRSSACASFRSACARRSSTTSAWRRRCARISTARRR